MTVQIFISKTKFPLPLVSEEKKNTNSKKLNSLIGYENSSPHAVREISGSNGPYVIIEDLQKRDAEQITDIEEEQVAYSLVIPAYNEEKRIGSFLEDLNDRMPRDYEIIIVCDGSDRTADMARSYGDRFRVLQYKHKLGKGGAILEGFKNARGSVIGYADADGSLGISEIVNVFQSVKTSDSVAIASRWVSGSKIVVRQPVLRIILGRLYHYVTFFMLGVKQKDTQCGLKAFGKDAVHEVMKHLTLNNISTDTAMLYHCKLLNYSVVEIPVTWKDVTGSKIHPVKTSLVMFATLLGIRLAHKSKSRRMKAILKKMHRIVKSL